MRTATNRAAATTKVVPVARNASVDIALEGANADILSRDVYIEGSQSGGEVYVRRK
jgi:hypothetical protein